MKLTTITGIIVSVLMMVSINPAKAEEISPTPLIDIILSDDTFSPTQNSLRIGSQYILCMSAIKAAKFYTTTKNDSSRVQAYKDGVTDEVYNMIAYASKYTTGNTNMTKFNSYCGQLRKEYKIFFDSFPKTNTLNPKVKI